MSSQSSEEKRILIIAGPNGAGKTTTALSLMPGLKEGYEFLNADEIARGLAPFHPESVALSASKLMLVRFRELLRDERSFAFETTAAATTYIKYIREAQKRGYVIQLTFIWLANADLAVKRVKQRVAQGGHHIPENVIRRRYVAGLRNLVKHYLPVVDSAIILDGSKDHNQNTIARKDQGTLIVDEPLIWEQILRCLP